MVLCGCWLRCCVGMCWCYVHKGQAAVQLRKCSVAMQTRNCVGVYYAADYVRVVLLYE